MRTLRAEGIEGVRARLRGVSWEAWSVVAATVLFIVLTGWWLAVDTRPPDNDGAKHMNFAWNFFGAFRSGDLLYWFDVFTEYPPLVHVVIALGLQPFGRPPDVEISIMILNVVFVPLLAAGTYNAGRIAFGRTAGLLAALFALTTPMIVSQFRSSMLDPPLTALIATSVWLLLASDRFSRRGYAIAAGVAMGLGMLTKAPFIFFIGGIVIVLLARGGWRNWVNVAICGAAVALVAGPWYLEHGGTVQDYAASTTGTYELFWYGTRNYPDRWTEENFTWYAWAAINKQYHLPLVLFFLAGAGVAVSRVVRLRRAVGYELELLVGGLVGYVGISYLVLDDPRYSLPALVYVAVLAAGGIVALRARWRSAAIAVFAAVCAINYTALAVPVFDEPVKVEFAGAPGSPIGERELTFFSSVGYFEGVPDRDYRIEDYLRAARRQGVRHVATFGPNFGFNVIGPFFARNGLDHYADPTRLGPEDMVVEYSPERYQDTPVCARAGGIYVYFRRGNRQRPDRTVIPVFCPRP
jgi:hypothetical protein